jgi:LysR family glycine cleavage system transcriptional activator
MYSHLPPMNSIKVFDAAARLGSFKKAAEELHVTPTAVSHQIKTLEEALGTLLFVRKTRAIHLTRDGQLLADTTYDIFQKLTNTISEISTNNNIITVSTTSSFAAMWLVPNLSKFNQLYPNIEVAVKTGEQVDDLDKDRRIDLVIRYGIYDSSFKNAVLLTTEEIGMYATPSYIEKHNATKEVNLLDTKWQNESLAEISWHKLLKGFDNPNITYKIRQFTQEHHIIQAALAGQGVALVSALLVQNAIEQEWLVKYNFTGVNKKTLGFSYYLIIPERNLHSKSIMAFKNWLVDEFM